MALKDWKRDSMYYKGYGFKKENQMLIITVESATKNEHFVDSWTINPFKNLVRRKFKNYKQALAFARQYMRTH